MEAGRVAILGNLQRGIVNTQAVLEALVVPEAVWTAPDSEPEERQGLLHAVLADELFGLLERLDWIAARDRGLLGRAMPDLHIGSRMGRSQATTERTGRRRTME